MVNENKKSKGNYCNINTLIHEEPTSIVCGQDLHCIEYIELLAVQRAPDSGTCIDSLQQDHPYSALLLLLYPTPLSYSSILLSKLNNQPYPYPSSML